MPADVSYLDSRYRRDERYGWQFNIVDSVAVATLDGRPVVVTGGLDGGVRVIDMAGGDRVCEFVPEGEFRATAVATAELQGRPVAVSGHNHGILRVIDMAAGRLLREWQFADGAIIWISALAVVDAGDRTLIAATTSDEKVRLWDLSDGTLAGERSDRKLEVIASVHSYIREQDGLPAMTLWDGRSTREFSLTCLAAGGLRGRPVVVAGYGDGTLYVCDLESGDGIWDRDAELAHRGLGAYVDSLAVCQFRGRPVIVAGGSRPGVIGAWDLADGSVVVEPFLSHEHTAVRGVLIADDRERAVMAAAGFDRVARIWDVQDRVLLDESEVNSPDPLAPLAVGRAEGQLVIVTGVPDGLVRVWRPGAARPQAGLAART